MACGFRRGGEFDGVSRVAGDSADPRRVDRFCETGAIAGSAGGKAGGDAPGDALTVELACIELPIRGVVMYQYTIELSFDARKEFEADLGKFMALRTRVQEEIAPALAPLDKHPSSDDVRTVYPLTENTC